MHPLEYLDFSTRVAKRAQYEALDFTLIVKHVRVRNESPANPDELMRPNSEGTPARYVGMDLTDRPVVGVAVAVLVVLSGCSGFLGTAGETTSTPVTPAPVPEQTATATDSSLTVATNSSEVTEPRYLSLRPTCERPPGLVIHIQVAALANDDPETHEGINTTWQFASPSNKRAIGTYDAFVDTITRNFRPLLEAERVTYGPLDRTNTTATRQVTVTTAEGETESYTWRVTRQSTAPYEGCWMTAGVVPDR
jgi:hypothetical protein